MKNIRFLTMSIALLFSILAKAQVVEIDFENLDNFCTYSCDPQDVAFQDLIYNGCIDNIFSFNAYPKVMKAECSPVFLPGTPFAYPMNIGSGNSCLGLTNENGPDGVFLYLEEDPEAILIAPLQSYKLKYRINANIVDANIGDAGFKTLEFHISDGEIQNQLGWPPTQPLGNAMFVGSNTHGHFPQQWLDADEIEFTNYTSTEFNQLVISVGGGTPFEYYMLIDDISLECTAPYFIDLNASVAENEECMTELTFSFGDQNECNSFLAALAYEVDVIVDGNLLESISASGPEWVYIPDQTGTYEFSFNWVTEIGGVFSEDPNWNASIYSYEHEAAFIVDEDTTWDTETFLSNNVVVTDGAILTIATTVHFPAQATLRVDFGSEVRLDGAILTSCSTNWGGIILDVGRLVTISGNNEISNASIGISLLERSRAIIDHEVFFINNSEHAIKAIDPRAIHIGNSVFDNCQDAILLSFPAGNVTIPNTGVSVTNNTFTGNDQDLIAMSANGNQNIRVQGNTFTGNIGIKMDGDNAYQVYDNTFTNQCIFGTLLYATGSAANNSQYLNEIASTSYGIVAYQENSTYQFQANCFQGNGIADIVVTGQFDHQGTQQFANGNCFTQDNIPDMIVNNNGTSEVFDYWEPLQGPVVPACVYSFSITPENYNPIQQSLGFMFPSACMPNSNPGGGNGTAFCNPPNTLNAIIGSLNQINAELAAIDQTTFSSQNAKRSKKSQLNRCLIKLYDMLASYYIENGMVNDAVAVYQQQSHFDMQIKGYFILMDQENYTGAEAYLNFLPVPDTEAFDFIQSSLILVEAKTLGSAFVFTTEKQNTVYQAALKEYPLAAYSRSIWLYLTGELIELNVDLSGSEDDRLRIAEIPQQSHEILIFPNPATDYFDIKMGDTAPDGRYLAKLLSFDGKLQVAFEFEGANTTCIIDTLEPGVYFLTISDENNTLLTTKKLVIH